MGLIYDAADSSRMKAGLTANLAAALAVLGDAESASRRLVSALATGELSGRGYSAVDALFSHVITPSLRDTKTEVESLQHDLEVYEWADSKVSRFGVLKEDELNVQLAATKRQRDATERLIEVNTAAASAIPVPLFGEGIELLNSQLGLVLAQLEKDIRDLEDRLGALKEFDATTRGLFLTGAPTRTVTSAAAAAAAKPDPQKTWSAAELMNLLALLSPSEVERILTSNPDLAQQFWDTPPPPEAVAAWWKTLDPEQREKWCQAANSPRGIVLQDILKALDVAKICGPGLDYERLAKQQKPPRGLLSYNSTHEPPLAAIAVGETGAEKSGKVTWTVPGMNSGLGKKNDTLSGWTNAAVNLYKTQLELEPGVSHMVVAWIGYEPPTQDLTVLHGDRARAGAPRLAAELDGQWAASSILGENPNTFTAVVGHSYGTTVVTDALSNVSSEGDAANGLEPTDGHDVLGNGADREGIGFLAHATAGHGYLNADTEAIHNTAAATLGLDHKINGGTRVGKD